MSSNNEIATIFIIANIFVSGQIYNPLVIENNFIRVMRPDVGTRNQYYLYHEAVYLSSGHRSFNVQFKLFASFKFIVPIVLNYITYKILPN